MGTHAAGKKSRSQNNPKLKTFFARNNVLVFPSIVQEAFGISQVEAMAAGLPVIGSNGAGKSTLVNLLLRFYDVNAGRILIDGQDAKPYQERLDTVLNLVGLESRRGPTNRGRGPALRPTHRRQA